MTETRPVPPTLRVWAADNDFSTVSRFAESNETLAMGVTATRYCSETHDSVRVCPSDAPDGFEIVSVTSHMVSGDDAGPLMTTRVQLRPEE